MFWCKISRGTKQTIFCSIERAYELNREVLCKYHVDSCFMLLSPTHLSEFTKICANKRCEQVCKNVANNENSLKLHTFRYWCMTMRPVACIFKVNELSTITCEPKKRALMHFTRKTNLLLDWIFACFSCRSGVCHLRSTRRMGSVCVCVRLVSCVHISFHFVFFMCRRCDCRDERKYFIL